MGVQPPSLIDFERAARVVIEREPVAGSDGESARDWRGKETLHASALTREMLSGAYLPRPWLTLYLEKEGGKKRILALPSMRDRVVMEMWNQRCGSILWKSLPKQVDGGRPGTGHLHLLNRACTDLLKGQYPWVLMSDLKDFYPSVSQTELLKNLKGVLVDDAWGVTMAERWLNTPRVFGNKIDPAGPTGVPLGLPVSPLLAHCGAREVDFLLEKHNLPWWRYFDDIFVLCPTRERGVEVLRELEQQLCNGLRLNAEKTQLVEAELGFEWLGHRWIGEGFIPSEPELRSQVRMVGQAGSGLCGQLLAGFLERGGGFGAGETPAQLDIRRLVAIEVEAAGRAVMWYRRCSLAAPLRTLYLQTQGTQVCLQSSQIIVRLKDEVLLRFPVGCIGQIVVMGSVQLSPRLLQTCLYRAIPVTYTTWHGRWLGRMRGQEQPVPELEEQQWQLLGDEQRRLKIASAMVKGRFDNALTLLRRATRSRSRTPSKEKDPLNQDLSALEYLDFSKTQKLDSLRGLEGDATRHLYRAYARIWDPKGSWNFLSRTRRPPTDPINSLLSFCCTLLHMNVQTVLELSGLNPRLGLYHERGRHHASLASDLIEEFRAPVAESTVHSVCGKSIEFFKIY